MSENSSNNFNPRIVNQTISSITLAWDRIPDTEVYKIERQLKNNIWTRVYWGSMPSSKVDHLDENFCYKFRISALKQPLENEEYITLETSDIIRATTTPLPPSTVLLFRAIKKGQQFLVKRLLNARLNLIDIPSPNGYTPLANAITFGEKDIIDILLGACASVHIGNIRNGTTPLHLAFYYGLITVAKMLLNKKANIDAKDCIGLTPAHYAIIADQFDTLKFALENNCDKEIKDICGWTLLLRAVAMRCSLPTLKLLLNGGALTDVTDKCGLTCLQIAKAFGNDEVLKYLRKFIAK